MAQNINSVTITGNLTRDPELRTTPGGTAVCSMRVAVNGRRKNSAGEWVDEANYFNVTVWGKQGENCAEYLAKGRPIAVQGRLSWREWKTQDDQKREAVEITANTVQFLNSGGDGNGRSERAPHPAEGDYGGFADDEKKSDVSGEFEPAATGTGPGGDDEIPFAFEPIPDYHALKSGPYRTTP